MMSTTPHHIRRNWPLTFGALILLLILVVALFGAALAPRDPMAQLYALRIGGRFVGPPYPPFAAVEFPLGSDQYGRDTLSRLLWGVQPTLILVVLVAFLRLLIGIVLGLVAGWSDRIGGRTAQFLTDAASAVPALIVALVVLAFAGADQGVGGFVLALTLTGWADTGRLVAAQTRQIRGLPFVQAAQALGAPNGYIVVRHLLRQILPLGGILFAFDAARTMLLTATLGFLGYFIGGGAWMTTGDFSAQQEAGLPELGQMLTSTGNRLNMNWSVVVVGLVVVLIVLGFNLLGEGLRRQADPMITSRADPLAALSNRLMLWFEALALALVARGRLFARIAVVVLVLGILGLAGGSAWAQLNTLPPTPVVLVVTVVVPQDSVQPRWSGALGDAGGALQTSVAALGEPAVRWSWNDPEGLSGGPAIAADGTVYLATRGGRLVALDANGEERWSAQLTGPAVGAPALGASGDIYVAEQPGSLAAFTTAGELHWRVPADVGREASSGPLSLPDGTVAYALVDRVRLVAPDGVVRWLSPPLDEYLDVPLRLSAEPPLLLAKGMIALNPADGTQVDLAGIVTQEQQNADPSTTLLVGADGNAYVRSGHALIELRTTSEGIRAGRKVEPNTGGLNLFFPTDAGVPAAGEDWLLYAGSFRDTRLLRVNEQGGITANGSVRQRESRMIGLDAAGTAYLCGSRSAFPECVALPPDSDTPLWSVVLEQRGKVVGGALIADGLYVVTDTGALVLLGR